MLSEIEKMSSLLTPISHICMILGLDKRAFRDALSDEDSEVYVRYHRGKDSCLLRLREQEIDEAEAGSPTAMLRIRDYVQQMEDEEHE